MKLSCCVLVCDRKVPVFPFPITCRTRHVNSTLALRKSNNSNEFVLILVNALNQNGVKYQVRHINKIITRFIEEGKVTLQFKEPQHDLCIQAEVILLKSFMHVLQQAACNTSNKQLLLSTSTSVPTHNPTVKKLMIDNLSDYPATGLPHTLEILYINNISRSFVDKGIFELTKLQVLDLSNNCLKSLPSELSNLICLAELSVPCNELGKANLSEWGWLDGNLSKTLRVLNLRDNELTYLPKRFIRLKKLKILHLDNNQLTCLPSGIGYFEHLHTLTASNNSITILPASTRKLDLQLLDLSNNNWNTECICNNTNVVNSLSSISLKEYASRSVIRSKIRLTPEIAPFSVIEELESTEYCLCGCPLFNAHIRQVQLFALRTVAESVSVSPANPFFIPINAYFCSVKCFRTDLPNRRRRDIVR